MKATSNFTQKTVNAGAKCILDLSSSLNQVLKTLDGLYSVKMVECDNMTVEEWFENMGVLRAEHTSQSGRVTKKGITVGTLKAGWSADMMADGSMAMYQSLVATYVDDNGESYKVYTEEEAVFAEAGATAKPITRWALRAVDFDGKGWTMRKILTALKQGKSLTRQNNRVSKELKAWQGIKKVYILKTNGENVQAVEVDKCKVTFVGR